MLTLKIHTADLGDAKRSMMRETAALVRQVRRGRRVPLALAAT